MIALAAAATAFAQFPSGLSVGAGYVSNTKKAEMKTPVSNSTETSTLGGFYINADYNIPIADFGLGVAPGIYFDYVTEDDSKEGNIGIPVNFNFSIPVADIIKIVPYLGPTFQYGLFSKEDDKNVYKESKEVDMKYNHFQLFLGGGVAVDIADIVRISFGYDFGLIKRINESEAGASVKMTEKNLHFGVAYLF